jgi:hypothetical protein
MSNFIAWTLFILGIGHIAYGVVKFKQPLALATAAGFSGFVRQFKTTEIVRTAFWFLLFGPLLMLAGHVAVHAVAMGDLVLLKIVGAYLMFVSVVGLAVLPRSPFLVAGVLSALVLAAGYGWL